MSDPTPAETAPGQHVAKVLRAALSQNERDLISAQNGRANAISLMAVQEIRLAELLAAKAEIEAELARHEPAPTMNTCPDTAATIAPPIEAKRPKPSDVPAWKPFTA